jgi:peptidyl-prolyl cis-trans isomerase D
MAVIGKIRQRAGLLIGIVGFSLVAFILGDLLTSNRSFLTSNDTSVAVIGGKKIDVMDFEALVQEYEQNYKLNTGTESIDQTTLESLREQAWNELLNNEIMLPQYNKAGVKVSSEELFDMIQGKNPHPQIKDAFKDPNTGEFSPANVINFLKNMDNDATGKTRAQWLSFEKFISEERVKEKFNDLVKHGLFVTTEEAKMQAVAQQTQASVRFVEINYSTVIDSTIALDDKELRDYYNANKNDFKQEDSRKLEYVTFDVVPSKEDMESAFQSIEKLAQPFRESTDDSLFVAVNSENKIEIDYFKSGTLSPVLETAFFGEGAAAGLVAGPYEENNTYRLSKLIQSGMMPDSIKVSHVLVAFAGAERAPAEVTRTKEEAKSVADSLLAVIKKDMKRYDDIATNQSDDKVASQKAGDLEWITRQSPMDPRFKSGAFEIGKGQVDVVESNFGYHIIKVTDQTTAVRQVKVATIDRRITAGSKTFQAAFSKANEFASKNTSGELFKKAVAEQGLNMRTADNIKPTDKFITGLESPRVLIQWAYNAKQGDVSKPYDLGNRFVIAHLAEVKEKGIAPLEQVKELVTGKVRTEKKAKMFMDQFNEALKSAKTIDEVAAKVNNKVRSAANVTFASGFVENLGMEPAFVGAVFGAEKGKITGPVKGTQGVSVIVVDNITEPPATVDSQSTKIQLQQQLQQRSSFEVFNALKEKANVTDNRSRFY